MDTKALRQKILDLAIRGKLVPQDPNDEPASVLLERIREEKKQMVKEGKLKAKDIKNDTIIFKGEDNLHYEKFQDGTVKCIEDEIPFDVPEGWEWCRLSNTCLILNGDRGQNYPAKNKLHSEGIPFVSASNIIDGEVSTDGLLYLSDAQYDLLGAGKLETNDIVFCIRGSLGKCGYFTMEKGAIASSLVIVRALSNKDYLNGYIFNYLNSLFAYDEIKKYDNGSAQPNLAAKDFQNFLVPLPAYEEIGRISDKCEMLLLNENDISVAAAELQDCISITKSKILDLAIRGKLVPQNPADEPASELLERIRTEKEKLIKQGKIKRGKKESIIYKGDDNSYYEKFANGEKKNITDEIPFNLPETWQWCRLKHIGNIIGGGTPKTAICDYWDGDIPWITPADLSGYDDIFISSGARNISVKGLNKSSAQLLPEGTVLFSSRAPIGYTAIASNEISTNQGFKSFVPATSEITSKYIYYCLKARYDDIVMRASGTTFKEISGSEMAETLIPLPPQNEQERITEYIVSFNDYISSIEANLS